MVEAAGVEPASGRDQRGTSTCVATSVALTGRPPKWQRSGQPALLVSGRLVRLRLIYEELPSSRPTARLLPPVGRRFRAPESEISRRRESPRVPPRSLW